MNWKQLSIWFTNIVMIITIIAFIFSAIVFLNLDTPEKDRFVRVGNFKITNTQLYQANENAQVKILDEGLAGSKLEISQATLKVPVQSIPWNGALIYISVRVLIFLIALYLVKEIMKTADNPFLRINVMRLKYLGALAILGGLVEKVESMIGSWFIHSNYELVGLELEAKGEINISLIITGLFLIVIAQVFKNGIQIKEDQDLTI